MIINVIWIDECIYTSHIWPGWQTPPSILLACLSHAFMLFPESVKMYEVTKCKWGMCSTSVSGCIYFAFAWFVFVSHNYTLWSLSWVSDDKLHLTSARIWHQGIKKTNTSKAQSFNKYKATWKISLFLVLPYFVPWVDSQAGKVTVLSSCRLWTWQIGSRLLLYMNSEHPDKHHGQPMR